MVLVLVVVGVHVGVGAIVRVGAVASVVVLEISHQARCHKQQSTKLAYVYQVLLNNATNTIPRNIMEKKHRSHSAHDTRSPWKPSTARGVYC